MFGQYEDASETMRLRLIWMLWSGLVIAMAVAIVFMSNLLSSVGQNLQEREDRSLYLEWVSAQIEVDFLGMQDTLRLAQSDGLEWSAKLLIELGLVDMAEKADALEQHKVAKQFAAESQLVSRLLREQRAFVERYGGFDKSDPQRSDALIDQMEVDISSLINLRRVLLQELLQQEVALAEQRSAQLAPELRRVFSSGSVVLMVLVLLIVINIFMLVALRQKSRALVLAMANLRTIITASRDAVFLAGPDLKVIGMGAAAEKMFARSEADAIGRPIFDFFANDRSEFDLFGQALRDVASDPKSAADYRVELNGQRADGSTFPTDVGFSVVADHAGDQAYVIAVTDTSDQAEREMNLMQARNEALQAERAKSRFLSAMSHEMRTPLNGVLASLDLMRGTTELDERQQELAAIIERCGDEALEQVENVLELTRLDTLANTAINVEPFAPAALLRELVDNNKSKARLNNNKISFVSTVPENQFVTGSSILFRQIMHNFLSNAIKFTVDGDIRVVLSAEEVADDSLLEFTAMVHDSGIGIDPDDLERIFNNFETIRDSYSHFRSGTGLGLSIAKHSADLLEGRIEVDSTPGKGSSFGVVIRWPKSKISQESEVIGTSTPSLRNGHQGMDVLVVEDNEINRQMLVDMLQAKGHKVTEAVDGLEGVSIGREHRFDLILMDISMPKLDGVGASRMLRQFGQSRHSPIVAVTAHSQPEHLREFLEAGMDRVLTKPLRMATLEQLFIELGQKQAPMAVAQTDEDQQEEDVMSEDLIEKDVFDGLIDMLGGDSVIGYVSQFETDATAMVEKYQHAVAGADFQTARAEAHRCAGGAAVIGAAKVHEVLQEMTHSADAGEAEKCLNLADSLPKLTRDTTQAMRSAIN